MKENGELGTNGHKNSHKFNFRHVIFFPAIMVFPIGRLNVTELRSMTYVLKITYFLTRNDYLAFNNRV